MSKMTIKMIANRAGTSTATVSRVINANYPVSDELRERINKVIKETSYRPNAIAASIRTQRSMTIGMIVSRFNNPLVMKMVLGVESVLEPEGYQLIISSSKNDLQKEKKVISSLQDRRVDAVVAVSVSKSDEIFKSFVENGIPVVIVDRSIPNTRLDVVVNDDRAATYKLARHLLDNGHTRIAVLKGNDDIVIGRERFQGFVQAMEEAGIPIEPKYQIEGEFQREVAYQRTLELFRHLPREEYPTAVLACNTLMAEGFMQMVYELELRIPQDISLVCYGILSSSPVFRPRIVCVDQRTEDIGMAAGRLILERVRGAGDDYDSVEQIIEARFVDGDSVMRI